MTINNLKAYVDNLWDWGFLDDCFGNTRIRVTDVDGLVERNGCFLLIEAKSQGKPVPMGQKILFRSLTQKGFTVLVLWGEPNIPIFMQVWHPASDDPEPVELCSADIVKCFVTNWFKQANSL